jgi:hypothetical protein
MMFVLGFKWRQKVLLVPNFREGKLKGEEAIGLSQRWQKW